MADTDDREGVAAKMARGGLVVGPAVFLAMLAMPGPAGLSEAGWHVAAVVALMAVLWLSQAIPLAATALVPIIAFPVLGVSPIERAAAPYAHPLIFLFLGGFVVALTIERWNLHRRIAIAVIGAMGRSPGRLIGGFMVASAGLSMWVSNTATALMMLPIATSVIAYVEAGSEQRRHDRFATALLLSVAYACSIGGIATLIGTPPNAFLAGYLSQNHGISVGFVQWMLLGVPAAAILLAAAWLLLVFLLRNTDLAFDRVRAGIAAARAQLGRPTRGERMAAILFAAVALAWVCQPLIARIVPLSDTGIALAAALAAFVTPVDWRQRCFLIDWETAARLPWGILLLFGGGLSLAAAIDSTGLAAWLGAQLSAARDLPPAVVVLLLTGLVVFLTELTSNTATTAVFVPIAATLGAVLGLAPLTLTVPTALAASCAFMMPVATPPNAIVFGSGRLTVLAMCRVGLLLNLAATAIIWAATLWLAPLVLE